MAALTAAFLVLAPFITIKKTVYPLAAGAKAFDGGMACYDTAAAGAVKQGAVSTTLKPLGKFLQTIDNTAGGSAVPIGVELDKEAECRVWDSVTGGGAITAANLFQTVYIASDHELTTVSTGASPYGIVMGFSPQGYPNGVVVKPVTP